MISLPVILNVPLQQLQNALLINTKEKFCRGCRGVVPLHAMWSLVDLKGRDEQNFRWPKIFADYKFLPTKKSRWPKIFTDQNMCWPKTMAEQKFSPIKIFCCRKKIQSKNVSAKKKFVQNIFLVNKKFWSTNFWSKKFLVHLGPKILCCLKKIQAGLTQGREYMPPSPENSRVKIVLGCC